MLGREVQGKYGFGSGETGVRNGFAPRHQWISNMISDIPGKETNDEINGTFICGSRFRGANIEE
jgi:hypothetical protein